MQHSQHSLSSSVRVDSSAAQERLLQISPKAPSFIQSASHLNNDAVAHFEASDHAEAIECYRKALSRVEGLNLSSFRRLSATGKTGSLSNLNYMFQRGEYDEGMHVYSHAYETEDVSPDSQKVVATIFYNLGLAHLELGQDSDANECFYRALALCPRRSSTYFDKKGDCAVGLTSIAILHNIGYIQYRTSQLEESQRTRSRYGTRPVLLPGSLLYAARDSRSNPPGCSNHSQQSWEG